MKRVKVLSIAAIAAVLVSTLTFSSEVYATSRTTTLEVAGAARTTAQPAQATQGAQVLGDVREGVINDDVVVEQITNAEAAAVLNDVNAVAEVIASTGVSVSTEKVAVLGSMELTAKPGVEVSEKNPLFVSFNFPGVTVNTKAFVCHFVNGKWAVEPTEVKDGLIVGKFTSLSPVAVVVDKTTLDSSVLGASKAKSPRTGDDFAWIIAICAAGAVVSSAVAYKAKKRA